MDELNIIQKLLGNSAFNIITAIVAVGAALSAALPSKISKGGWFGSALQFVADLGNLAGINWGKAKNADDPA
jgi:hypothetical protein